MQTLRKITVAVAALALGVALFAAPAGAAMVGARMVQDQPWGLLWTSFVSVGAVLSVLSAFVGIELVRTMWLWTQPGEPTSGLLGMLGGMFGN